MYSDSRAVSPRALRSLITPWVSTSSLTTTPGHTADSSSSRLTTVPARSASATSRFIAFGSSRTVSAPRRTSLLAGSTYQAPTRSFRPASDRRLLFLACIADS